MKDPKKDKCIEGMQHSIGMYTGICSNCKKRFWETDKEGLKRWNKAKKILNSI